MPDNTVAAKNSFLSYSFDALGHAERYKLMLGSVIPRPVAFVASLNDQGKTNLAPFSNFMIVSSNTGLMAFSVGADRPGDKGEKDTLRNIRQRGEYVINTVSHALASQVQSCAEVLPPDVSEAEQFGIRLVPSQMITKPRVADARVQFECRLHSINPVGDSNIVVGQVLCIHVEEAIVDNFKIDPRSYSPLGRIAGRSYCTLGELIEV